MQTRSGHGNNFDLIRLAAALVVVVSHAYALQIGYAGVSGSAPLLLVGYTALAALFTISGLLIPQSWLAQPEAGRFFWKRSLRVFPGLVAAILFTLFVIGPIATTLSPNEYFSTLFSGAIATLPFFEDGSALGLFIANPVSFVNASLWTIPVEFTMYILVAVLGLLGLLRKKHALLLLIAANVLLWMALYHDPGLSKVRFTLYFLIGAYLSIHHPHLRYDGMTALLLALALVAAAGTPAFSFLALIAVPYIVLWFAALPVPAFNRVGDRGDFSYGVYIYAYPIQQTIVLFLGTGIPLWLFCALSVAVTFPLAYVSWNFIEKRALGLKQMNLESVKRRFFYWIDAFY
ncbi:MAG: hypothetical protein PWP08_696 [Methanofollis sp.]|nr:hypothetical protein [Methanofollis sp.]